MSAAAEPDAQGDSASIAGRALRGAVALGLRQVIVQGLNLLGGIALARLLTPAEFGIYAISTFLLSFLGQFGDVGLGASLVRQPHEPEVREYRAMFSVQQVMVLVVVAAFWFAAPPLTRAYDLDEGHRWTLRIVALSLFFMALRALPAARLERELAFDRLAIANVAETFVFNVLAVSLAYLGHGAQSFAFAILARSIVGACVVLLVSPLRLGFVWDWPLVKSHLSFGLAFQGISLVSLVKDSITPVLVGLVLGAADVGYINWAQQLAAYAVIALMAFHSLYLPAFARLQGDRAALGNFVERTIWATNAITAPLAVTTLVLFDPITTLVFGAKWLVAKPLFLLLAFANVLVPTVTPLLGLFNALGRPRLSLAFAVVWMLSTWVFGAPLVLLYGSIGYALANVLVQLTNLALLHVAKGLVPFRILPTIWRVWLAAAIAGVAVLLVNQRFPAESLSWLVGYCILSLGLFFGALWLVDRANALAAWQALRKR
jgi:O-antigen/teichoic acid export membrane protein